MPRTFQQNLFAAVQPDDAPAAYLTRPYIQKWVDRTFVEAMEHDSGLLVAATGTGKCLARGTPVLMFNGRIRPVERIRVGDLLMGPDSLPRRVLGLASGREMMYQVTPTKGDPYVVNESHILSVKMTPRRRGQTHTLLNIPVREFVVQHRTFKHRAKGWRTGVDFRKKYTPIEPYFLGLWLGDGESTTQYISTTDPEVIDYLEQYAERLGMILTVGRSEGKCPKARITYPGHRSGRKNPLRKILRDLGVANNKHLPHDYLTSSRRDRLEILAGLIDSDGSATNGCYDFSSTNPRIADGVIYLARSLGFAAYGSTAIKACQTGAECLAHRVCISGNTDEIPVRIERKKQQPRRQIKNHLVHGITVEPIGIGDYYGFEIDGDKLFLLGDFTVTHNTPYAGKLFQETLNGALAFKYPGRSRRACLFIAHENELIGQAAATLRAIMPTANVQIEQGDCLAGGEADVVVASRDTICKPGRLRSFGRDRFDVILPDEAHRYAMSSSKWARIRNFFNGFFVGVTATADRGDGQSLRPSFESLIDYYPMLDAINDGWLVPIHQRYEYLDEIDLDVTHRGDWTDEEIADRMAQKRPLATMTSVMRKYGCMPTRYRLTRPVVGVCASPKIAEAVARELNDWDKKEGTGRAVYLHGKQDEDERAAANIAFKSGAARYLCIYEVGLEGYDYDEIGVVVNGRPTTKRYKVEQMAGRMVRPLNEIRDALAAAPDAAARRAIIAASRKPGGLFVDLTGTQLKLQMKMATLADVFAGRELPIPSAAGDPLAALKARAAVSKKGMNDVAGTMAELVAEERQRIRETMRQAKQADADRWAALGIRVRTKHINLNPFDLFDVRFLPSSVISPGRAASLKWRRALENMGLEPDIARRLTKRQARQWMEVIRNRKLAGLCTYKQAKKLREYGYNPNSTREECDAAFAELKANGWQYKKPQPELSLLP